MQICRTSSSCKSIHVCVEHTCAAHLLGIWSVYASVGVEAPRSLARFAMHAKEARSGQMIVLPFKKISGDKQDHTRRCRVGNVRRKRELIHATVKPKILLIVRHYAPAGLDWPG